MRTAFFSMDGKKVFDLFDYYCHQKEADRKYTLAGGKKMNITEEKVDIIIQ